MRVDSDRPPSLGRVSLTMGSGSTNGSSGISPTSPRSGNGNGTFLHSMFRTTFLPLLRAIFLLWILTSLVFAGGFRTTLEEGPAGIGEGEGVRRVDNHTRTEPRSSQIPKTFAAVPELPDRRYADRIARLSLLGPPSPSCFSDSRNEPPFDSLLILAQGRSGSTSLLRLLNRIPCVNIRGENPDLFHSLLGANSFRSKLIELATNSSHWGSAHWNSTSVNKKPSWFNRMDLKASDEVLRELIGESLEHVPGKVVSGFKSITLFLSFTYAQSVSFLDDWIDLFPRTLIVFLTRNGVEASGWWRATEDAADKLAEQAKGFARFADAVRDGRYLDVSEHSRVEVAEVSFEDMVGCNLDALAPIHALLGHSFDAPTCAEIMRDNIEDYGIAMSEDDYSTVQGTKGWTYGHRIFELPSEPNLDFGAFQLATELVPAFDKSDPPEHASAPLFQTSQKLHLGKALHSPVLSSNKKRAAAPCRKWTSDRAFKATIEVRVPGTLLPKCNDTPHGSYSVHLLVDDKPLLSRRFELGGQGADFRYTMELLPWMAVEVCAVPELDRKVKKGDAGVCQPVLVTVAVIRGGRGGSDGMNEDS